jgi:hypothetical protein
LPISDKAYALRILLVSRWKIGFMCKSSYLRLDNISDREHRLRKLLLSKLTKEIALILIRISSCKNAIDRAVRTFNCLFAAIMKKDLRKLKKYNKLINTLVQNQNKEEKL